MNLVALLQLLLMSYSLEDELVDFVCIDGTKIKLKQACDGLKDCPDGSDETKVLCYHVVCPSDLYRCNYGACIKKEARCDGKLQCADGSDESRCGKNKNSCDTTEFQCLSGECITNKKLCDDTFDCEDESDENKDTCAEFLCPENTHRCKHGGCIHLDARCNGFQDCVDGSDESNTLCESLKCKGKQCDKVQKNIFCPPIVSSRITVKCKIMSSIHKGWLPCDKPLPIGTVAQYECNPYYQPINAQHANNTSSVCQPDGTWNRKYLRCEPECGRAAPVVAPLIVHGWIVEHGMWPWHATLYTLQEDEWKFWCGGSLISERIVITAAHCCWKLSADTMKVALGNYFADFKKTEDFTQTLDVEEIIMQPLYQDILGNFGSDIAILLLSKTVQFSPFVKPVCVDWELHDLTEHLSGTTLGMIVGLGVTEDDTVSDKLRATFLPAIDDIKCIEAQTRDFKKYVTYTSFCAGWRNGTGVCNGDSGGGLVFPKSSNKSEWVLQGIVSVSPRRLGTSFCDPNYYTIFTKVGMYVDWIQNVLDKIHPERTHQDNNSEDNNVIL